MPEWTPWGVSQQKVKIMRGVSFHHTARHGGVAVAKALAERHGLDKLTTKYNPDCKNGYYWFEEDCDWSLPYVTIPGLIAAAVEMNNKAKRKDDDPITIEEYKNMVEQVCSAWHPEVFKKCCK